MDSIVSNITGGFLNDILKATAPEREYANYQNIILPELVSAVKKYNDFKDSVLESLRSRKSQPTIKEAFAKCQRDTKCERDVFVKKLNEHDALLKEYININTKMDEKIDYFMRIKMVDDVVKVVECVSPLESAHQKAREYTPKVVEDTPKVVEDTPNVVEETPNVVEETPKVVEETPKVVEDTPKVVEEAPKVVEETPNIQITITENDVNVADETDVVAHQTTDEAIEETEEVDVEEETTEEVEVEEETTDELEEVEEETTEEVDEVAEQAPDATGSDAVEEDVSEEEIEVDAEEEEEEVEEFTHKGKKYYVTNTTNGKIYSCTADDDIGDQVGSFKNGKPIFS
jgi:hypothetical protein